MNWKQIRAPVILMGAVLLLIFCVAAVVGVAFTALPLAAPFLSQQVFGTPEQIWSFYVDLYNSEYRGTDDESLHIYREALSTPFADGAPAPPIDEWVVLRTVQGKIVSDTLTLDATDNTETTYAQGQVKVVFEQGPPRCFRVAFMNKGGYMLVRLVRLASCGEP